jgi:hypothetical protein
MQLLEQHMQDREIVGAAGLPRGCGKDHDGRVGAGQRGLAQKQGGRKALHGAAHDAFGVLGLHLSVHRDAQFAERPVGGEGMGDIAERVVLLIEPAILGHVDAPAHHVLSLVVARREPQQLDHAGGGSLVPVDGLVRDADAHCRIISSLPCHRPRKRTIQYSLR